MHCDCRRLQVSTELELLVPIMVSKRTCATASMTIRISTIKEATYPWLSTTVVRVVIGNLRSRCSVATSHCTSAKRMGISSVTTARMETPAPYAARWKFPGMQTKRIHDRLYEPAWWGDVMSMQLEHAACTYWHHISLPGC